MIQEFTNYLQTVRGYSPLTCEEYRKDLTSFVVWLKATTDIRRFGDVNQETVQEWVADLVAAGLQATTIKRRVSALRSLYTYARGRGLTKTNPAQYVSTPKKARRLPKLADATAIRSCLYNPYVEPSTKLAVALLSETGMRISELCTVKMTDINKSTHSIRIIGKGNKERYVYYGKHTKRLLESVANDGGRIIKTDTRETRHDVYKAIGSTPHNVRHLYATTMLNNGADIKTISQLLGHESVKTTEIYSRMDTARISSTYNKYQPKY